MCTPLILTKTFRSEKLTQQNREKYDEGKVAKDPADRLQQRDVLM